MWVFALPWGVWSYEITSGASVAGVGIPTLSCCRRKSFAGGSSEHTFFFFAMYPGDFTLGNELAMNELFWK